MADFEVKDINLYERGQKKIDWAWQYMPSLQFLYNKYKNSQPFKGAVIAACLHLEARRNRSSLRKQSSFNSGRYLRGSRKKRRPRLQPSRNDNGRIF